MPLQLSPERVLLLLGLAFFFGLAFEEYYGAHPVKPPGGVRTFPLLSITGAGLYLVDTAHALAFVTGLVALAAWLFSYYRDQVTHAGGPESGSAELVVPVCNLLAYLLGPIALIAPIWVTVGLVVVAVLLLDSAERLHRLARRISPDELTTLAKFLILTGIVLPLLPNAPVTHWTAITPYQVWLAVVAVSTLSYLSYLAQRYLVPKRGSLLAALLGGLYSSTATTVVIARRLKQLPEIDVRLQAGIVLATAVMYLRIVIVVGLFDFALARALALPMLPLFAAALLFAWWCSRRGVRRPDDEAVIRSGNPLELGTAFLFAALFIVVSLVTGWMRSTFGAGGLFALAAIVGVSDVDPFVLSVAQGAASSVPVHVAAAAILVAASSNNLLKAGYAVAFGGRRAGLLPSALLALLALAGVVIALWW